MTESDPESDVLAAEHVHFWYNAQRHAQAHWNGGSKLTSNGPSLIWSNNACLDLCS